LRAASLLELATPFLADIADVVSAEFDGVVVSRKTSGAEVPRNAFNGAISK